MATFALAASLALVAKVWAVSANQFGRVAPVLSAIWELTLPLHSVVERCSRPLATWQPCSRTISNDVLSSTGHSSIYCNLSASRFWYGCIECVHKPRRSSLCGTGMNNPVHGLSRTCTGITDVLRSEAEIRDKMAALKKQGKPLTEVVAAKPGARYDAEWGNLFQIPSASIALVYQ